MGVRTLEEFREDLAQAIGGRGVNNRWLDRRINAGYLDLATMILHDSLRVRATVPTVVGTESYNVDRLIGIVTISHEDKILVYTDYSNIVRNRPAEGMPALWADDGDGFRVYPTPAAVYSLIVDYYREPNILGDPGDATELEARWDHAVHLFACHYSFLDLGMVGEGGQANEYLHRAMNYVQSRVKSWDIRSAPVQSVNVPSSMAELSQTHLGRHG